jgi:DHA2 family multidrug resistance protein
MARCASGCSWPFLDIQVVASSLTNIAAALDLSDSQLGWIQTSYLMAEVIAIPLTALLTRAFSLRWMFAAATLCLSVIAKLLVKMRAFTNGAVN